MRISTYEEAVALGPLAAEAWLKTFGGVEPMKDKAGKPKQSDVVHRDLPSEPKPDKGDGMNKLERAFWLRLQDAEKAGVFGDVWHHSMKFKVIGPRWYVPDFVSRNYASKALVFWETKGKHVWEDSILKLMAASEKYPCFSWVLVRRDVHVWKCAMVTESGIAGDLFTPDWLR